MNTTDLFSAVMQLDLEPIKTKLMHLASGEGWSRDKANAVEKEYRRFLCLMKLFPNEDTAPLVDVDTFWHYHILDTMKYAVDCEQVFGYFLHHYPYVGMDGSEEDEQFRLDSGERMRALYEATFGEDYPDSPDEPARAAYCAGPAVKAETAYCAGPAVEAGTAYCAGPADKTKTAYCAGPAAKVKAELAYCAGPAAKIKAELAYCAGPAAKIKAELAYCAGPAVKVKTAYCAGPADKTKTAYCAGPAARVKAELAYCAGPAAKTRTAYCAGPALAAGGRGQAATTLTA